MLLATTRYGRKFHLVSSLEFTICGRHQTRQASIPTPDAFGTCQVCVRASMARLRKAGIGAPADVDTLHRLERHWGPV